MKATAKPSTNSSTTKDVNKDLLSMLPSVKQYPVVLSSGERDEEQSNATQDAESETPPKMQAPKQIAVFTSIEEAGRHFQNAFARGDRSRQQFLIGNELWEVIDGGIPRLRPVRQ